MSASPILLPPAIVQRLCDDLGAPPDTIEPLGGMSGGRVYRVGNAAQSRIIKRTTGTMERHFYQQIAPRWSSEQRHTPTFYWAMQDADDWWLALEAIPQPLPQQRHLADPELLAILRQLHQLDSGALLSIESRYRPSWVATLTLDALNNLDPRAQPSLATVLERHRQEAQALFTPSFPISGDPNPANWGLRDDGSLVLFDWERVTLGSPALDLAITVPGLGQWDDYARVAATYLRADIAGRPSAVAVLTRAIALAKLWTVVEFLAHNTLADARTTATVRWLRHEFPGWLRLLSQELR